jgi:hypothetical protein
MLLYQNHPGTKKDNGARIPVWVPYKPVVLRVVLPFSEAPWCASSPKRRLTGCVPHCPQIQGKVAPYDRALNFWVLFKGSDFSGLYTALKQSRLPTEPVRCV